ncbi:MAG TPA: histidine kinase [Thermaerobacter sp.]
MPTLWGWVATWGLILGTALALWWFARRTHYQRKQKND